MIPGEPDRTRVTIRPLPYALHAHVLVRRTPTTRALTVVAATITLLVASVPGAVAQSCVVTWVSKESVWRAGEAEPLTVGQTIASSDTLAFAGPQGFFRAVCPGRGALVFRPPAAVQDADQETRDNVLVEQMGYAWSDLVRETPLMVRGSDEERAITSERALLKELRGSGSRRGPPHPYVLLGTRRLRVEIDDYPLGRGGAFGFLLPTEDGERRVELPAEGDALVIEAELFTLPSGSMAEASALARSQLYYRDRYDRYHEVMDVHLVVPDEEALCAEVRPLLSALAAAGLTETDVQVEEVASYISSSYGEVHTPTVAAWLDSCRTGRRGAGR